MRLILPLIILIFSYFPNRASELEQAQSQESLNQSKIYQINHWALSLNGNNDLSITGYIGGLKEPQYITEFFSGKSPKEITENLTKWLEVLKGYNQDTLIISFNYNDFPINFMEAILEIIKKKPKLSVYWNLGFGREDFDLIIFKHYPDLKDRLYITRGDKQILELSIPFNQPHCQKLQKAIQIEGDRIKITSGKRGSKPQDVTDWYVSLDSEYNLNIVGYIGGIEDNQYFGSLFSTKEKNEVLPLLEKWLKAVGENPHKILSIKFNYADFPPEFIVQLASALNNKEDTLIYWELSTGTKYALIITEKISNLNRVCLTSSSKPLTTIQIPLDQSASQYIVESFSLEHRSDKLPSLSHIPLTIPSSSKVLPLEQKTFRLKKQINLALKKQQRAQEDLILKKVRVNLEKAASIAQISTSALPENFWKQYDKQDKTGRKQPPYQKAQTIDLPTIYQLVHQSEELLKQNFLALTSQFEQKSKQITSTIAPITANSNKIPINLLQFVNQQSDNTISALQEMIQIIEQGMKQQKTDLELCTEISETRIFLDSLLKKQDLSAQDIKTVQESIGKLIKKVEKAPQIYQTAFEASILENPNTLTQLNITRTTPPYSTIAKNEANLRDKYHVFYSANYVQMTIVYEIFSQFRSLLAIQPAAFIRNPLVKESLPETVQQFKEIYAQMIKVTSRFDHEKEIKKQLLAASYSLFSYNSMESAIDFFINKHSLSSADLYKTILTDFLTSLELSNIRINEYIQTVEKFINENSFNYSGLMQIFIKKSVINKLAYFSGPYGIPLLEQEILNLSHFLDIFRKINKSPQEIKYYEEIKEKTRFDSPQIRILVKSPLFFDQNNIKIYFHYSPADAKKIAAFFKEIIIPKIHEDIEELREKSGLKQPILHEAQKLEKNQHTLFQNAQSFHK